MEPFKKDPNMKYTDMCIYIDSHMNDVKISGKNPEIEEKIFQYMYHVIYALAWKKRYFNKCSYYEDFALYVATEMYMTMRERAGDEIVVKRGRELKPIKSFLNYIKGTLYQFKVDFEKVTYSEIFNPEVNEEVTDFRETLSSAVKASYSSDLLEDLIDTSKNIPEELNFILDKQTPFKDDPVMKEKLYISAMLTFINDITLSNEWKKKWEGKDASELDRCISSSYNNYSRIATGAVLWHLDPRFEGYVRILTNKLKRFFTDELLLFRARTDLSDELIDSILKSGMNSTEDDDEQ